MTQWIQEEDLGELEGVSDPYEVAQKSKIHISRDKDFTIGIAVGDDLAGALFTSQGDRDTFSFDVCVLPEYRRQGLATQLTKAALDEYRESLEWYPERVLEVQVVNPDMARILARAGLVQIAERGGSVYYGHGPTMRRRALQAVFMQPTFKWDRQADLSPPLGYPGGICHTVDRIEQEVSNKREKITLTDKVQSGDKLSNPEANIVYDNEVENATRSPLLKEMLITPHAQYRMDQRGITVPEVRLALDNFLSRFYLGKEKKDSFFKATSEDWAWGREIVWEDTKLQNLVVVFSGDPSKRGRVKIITTYWRGQADPRPSSCKIPQKRAGAIYTDRARDLINSLEWQLAASPTFTGQTMSPNAPGASAYTVEAGLKMGGQRISISAFEGAEVHITWSWYRTKGDTDPYTKNYRMSKDMHIGEMVTKIMEDLKAYFRTLQS